LKIVDQTKSYNETSLKELDRVTKPELKQEAPASLSVQENPHNLPTQNTSSIEGILNHSSTPILKQLRGQIIQLEGGGMLK